MERLGLLCHPIFICRGASSDCSGTHGHLQPWHQGEITDWEPSHETTWRKIWQAAACQWAKFGYLPLTLPCSHDSISWSIHHLPRITNQCSITSWLKIHSLFPKADILTWKDIALARTSGHLRPLARAIWEQSTEKENSSLTDWFVVTIRNCSGMWRDTPRASLSREGGQKSMNLSSSESSAVHHQLLQFITEMSCIWSSGILKGEICHINTITNKASVLYS